MSKKLIERLRDMQSKKYNHTWAGWVQSQTSQAADIIEQQAAAFNAKEVENLALHRKLAAVDLDAKTAWSRYENANSSRKSAEVTVEQQAAEIERLRARCGNMLTESDAAASAGQLERLPDEPTPQTSACKQPADAAQSPPSVHD
jgi:single-stranded DNA-binding protein